MQESSIDIARQRVIIRIGKGSMSFSTINATQGDSSVVYEPYTIKSGISAAANLREALKSSPLLTMGFQRVLVMVDAPVLMVPTDLFKVAECHDLYVHSFPDSEGSEVLYDPLTNLDAVALYPVNKDLRLVVNDHFRDVKWASAASPVWRYFHQRSYAGTRSKLYAYFHDGRIDIFSYAQNRFKFYNTFDVRNAHDALYFLLYVWKQLAMKEGHDELHLAGDIVEREWLIEELKRYLKRVYIVNPSSEFNRSPVTEIKAMPLDLMTYFVRGR